MRKEPSREAFSNEAYSATESLMTIFLRREERKMEPVRRQLRNSVRRSDDDPKSALEKSQESNTASVKTQPQKHAFENETPLNVESRKI